MLNGASCSGKSTIIKRVMSEKGRYYQLSYDSQKRLFSKFSPSEQYQDVGEILKTLAKTVCEMGYDIICDSGLDKESRELLLSIPKEYGYEIIEINLEADYEVLEKRFEERVQRVAENPTVEIYNTSKERFRELYEMYEKGKNPSVTTFRTDQDDNEAIAEQVLSFA